MEKTQILLTEIKDSYNNQEWLSIHSDALLESIKSALSDEGQRGEAVNSLLLTFPYILSVGNIKLWSQILRTAFDIYAGEEDFGAKSGLFWATFQTELIDKEVRAAMRRVRRLLSPTLIMDVYVNLFQLQAYRMVDSIDEKLILAALDLGRTVNNQEAYAKLNRAFAYAFARQGEFEQALEYARLAYNYWVNTRNKVETGIVAYAMALSYRFKKELDVAEHWLIVAGENFSQTRFPGQYAIIACERGNILMMIEDYPAAYEWLTIANNEAQILDAHTRANIQHSLGIVETHLGYYEDAEDNLNLSVRYWQDVDNGNQIAHVLYAFAFLAYKQNDFDEAIRQLDESEAIYAEVRENKFNGIITSSIQSLREKINNER